MFPSEISSSKHKTKTSNMTKFLISKPSHLKVTVWYYFTQKLLKKILLLLVVYFNAASWANLITFLTQKIWHLYNVKFHQNHRYDFRLTVHSSNRLRFKEASNNFYWFCWFQCSYVFYNPRFSLQFQKKKKKSQWLILNITIRIK